MKTALCLACVAGSLAICVSVGGAGATDGVDDTAANRTGAGRLDVSVLWFENGAGRGAEHWSHALGWWVRGQVREVKAIRLRGGTEYAGQELGIAEGSALRPDQARRIGEFLGVRHVIWGGYERIQDKWQVSLYVLDVATGAVSDPLTATSTDWYDIRDKLTEQILEHLKISPSEDEHKKLIRRETASPQALEWYAKACTADAEERPLSEQEDCERRAIAADPQFARAHVALAATFSMQGKFAEAEETLRRALEISPDDAQTHLLLGLVLAGQLRLTEAEIELHEALRLEPDDAPVLSRLAQLYSAQCKWDEAIVYDEKAIAMEPLDASTHAHLGLAYTQTLCRDKALAQLKRAESLIVHGSTLDMNAEQMLCQAYQILGETALAVEHYERFLDLARKIGMNPEMIADFEEPLQRLEAKLTPTYIEASLPRLYTEKALREELTRRLTAEELDIVVNPIAGNADTKRWAEQLTEGIVGDLERAKAIFDGLVRRIHLEGAHGTRTAQEVFAAWDDPHESFTCQEYAKLYVALARDVNVQAFYVHVDQVYNGTRAAHDCTAVFAEGKVLLVDPTHRWFGAPHKEFVILDDLQAIAHHFFQESDVSRCRLAAKLHPDHAWGQLMLAKALRSAQQPEEALKAVEAAESLEPGRWDILLVRGSFAVGDGDVDAAEDYLRQALELNPRSASGHCYLGLMLAMKAEFKEAGDELRASVRYDLLNEITETARTTISTIDEIMQIESSQEYTNAVLVFVSQGGHADTIKRLLAEGADINARNKGGVTPLMMAAQEGHTEIVELLLQSNANVNVQAADGRTALMIAALNGHAEIVKLLLQSNANVNVQAADGLTALMIAALNGDAEIVRLLLQSKADVNTANNYGCTALMAAAAKGDEETVRLLIAEGADITAASAGGHAVRIARENGHTEIVELLAEALQSQLATWLSQGMPIAPSEVLAYYEQVKAERFIKTSKVHIRLIDIRPSELKPAQIKTSQGETREAAALRIAAELCERIRGGEDFGVLAETFSHGHRRSLGGLWTPFTPGALSPPYDVLDAESQNMQPGQVSEPIQKDGHVFVVKLEQRLPPSVQVFDEVKDVLEAELQAIKRTKLEEATRRQ